MTTKLPADGNGDSNLAPFNPTCVEAQETALGLLQLNDSDVLFDVGCGDARFLLKALQKVPGLRCVGIEMDSVYASRARESTSKLSLEMQNRIDIREEDVLESSGDSGQQSVNQPGNQNRCGSLTLRDDATAVYLFLLPKGLVKLKPFLESVVKRRQQEGRKLQIVTYMFQIHGWIAAEVDVSTKGGVPIYHYSFNEGQE